MRSGLLTVWLFLFVLPLHAQSELSLRDVLPKVRSNVQESWRSLPDFVCTEKITSEAFENGSRSKRIVIESLFTATRKQDQDGYSMVESREVIAVDGKAVRKGTAVPSAPLLPDGSTANLLFASFVLDAHDYKQVANGPLLLIEFASK